MVEWVRAFDWRPDGKTFRFGNSVYAALPVSFGGDTKSRRSLLSGVYARGSKRPLQYALECVTVVDSTAHSKLPQSASMRLKTLPCTEEDETGIEIRKNFYLSAGQVTMSD